MEVRFSIECVDNPVGLPGVVIYEDITLGISYKQGAPVGAGHGPRRSVRSFHSSRCGETLCDPPQAGNVAPSYLAIDEVIPMEVEEQERENPRSGGRGAPSKHIED